MKEGDEHGVIDGNFTYPVQKIERHTHEFHSKSKQHNRNDQGAGVPLLTRPDNILYYIALYLT